KIALLGAGVTNKFGPLRPCRPGSSCGSRGKIQIRRRFYSEFPLFRRNFETDVFKLRQRGHETIIQFKLAVIALFVRGECCHYTCQAIKFELVEEPTLQCFADQQRTIDVQISQPTSALSNLLGCEIEIPK